jgi:hypothetical protein
MNLIHVWDLEQKLGRKYMKKLIIASLLVASTASADPVGGTKRGRGVIAPGETDTYEVVCRADELTVFEVNGDGDGDIDCKLYDEGGHQVDSDTSPRDGCRVSVPPAWTGAFELRVTNAGRYTSAYTVKVW